MKKDEPNALFWLILSAGVVLFDQFTKLLAFSRLEPGVPVPVVDGWLSWTLAYNTGAAFSFLAQAGGWQRWLFSGLALVVSGALVAWLTRTPRSDWKTALPVALIVGGAIGNLIDRVRYGQVTDFIQVYHGDWSFAAFNVADSAISVGAVALVVFGLFAGRQTKA